MSLDAIRITRSTPRGEATALVRLVGGGIREFRFGGREVMPLDTDLAYRKWFSGVVMAPWSNRLRDGSWELQAAPLQLPINDSLGHALHGLVFARRFDVVEQSPDAVTVSCAAGGVPGYPLDVRLEVTYRLQDDGLAVTMTATNRSDVAAPVVLGAHPYFAYDAGATLQLDAGTVYELDARKIPTGRTMEPDVVGVRSGQPVPVDALALDDTFTALTHDERGRAHTLLRHADGWVTDVWQGPGMPCTVVFTGPDPLWVASPAQAIAIEPQTAPTDAFNSGTDLVWLEPAAQLAVEWGVAVRGPVG